MLEWINQTLDTPTFSLTVLLAAFLLGIVSSLASTSCTIPIVGALAGYSSTRKTHNKRAPLTTAILFMIGATVALIIIGSVAGFIGQLAHDSLGKYWKIFAGIIAILFGLATLNLLPFKLPGGSSTGKTQPAGLLSAAFFGLVMGGAVSICSMCCNPGIFIILGVVILHGYSILAITILTAYAFGFSLPLTAIVLGVSFGAMAAKAKIAEKTIRIFAGALLIIAGFYFLATI